MGWFFRHPEHRHEVPGDEGARVGDQLLLHDLRPALGPRLPSGGARAAHRQRRGIMNSTGCPVLVFATLKRNSVISKRDKTIL